MDRPQKLRLAIVATRELLPAERDAVNFVMAQLYRKIPSLIDFELLDFIEPDDDGEPVLVPSASPSGDDGGMR